MYCFNYWQNRNRFTIYKFIGIYRIGHAPTCWYMVICYTKQRWRWAHHRSSSQEGKAPMHNGTKVFIKSNLKYGFCRKKDLQLSFSFHFLFFVFVDKVTKIRKYYVIMFVYFFYWARQDGQGRDLKWKQIQRKSHN